MIGRVRQGLNAMAAWFRPVDRASAAEVLSPPLLVLFDQMRAGEAQHSLRVLRTLRARGEDDPRLLSAALLHDVGKSRAPYWLWERVIVVLAKRFVPARASRWGDGEPVGWRRPFVISKQHPAWGAQMVAAADPDVDPLTVELIARHQCKLDQVPQPDRLLAALQAADDEN